MLLALDIATKCGIAVGPAGGDFRSLRAWSHNLGAPPEDRRLSQMARMSSHLIEDHKPDLIAYEASIGGADRQDYLIALIGVLRAMAWNRGVPAVSCNIGSVRKVFCGRAWSAKDFPHLASKPARRRAVKEKVLARCRLLGISVDDHDAADAAAIHHYASVTHCGALAAIPGELFHRKETGPPD